MDDLISRQAAIEHLKKRLYETALNNVTEHPYYEEMADNRVSVWLKEVPSAQPEVAKDTNVTTNDCISRQAAIDAINALHEKPNAWLDSAVDAVMTLPSAQQTLYGYKIEHLAYIARVMEKEGVTAEYAVRTFDDMSRAVRMIMEEAQQKAEEMLNERFN